MASAANVKLVNLGAAAITTVACAAALAACGGSQLSSTAELDARRADLAQVAHALMGVKEDVAQEVAAARLAWPLLDRGIPQLEASRHEVAHRASDPKARRRARALLAHRERELAQRLATLKRRIAGASARAQRIYAPLVAHSEELTGAGSQIASVYELGAGLVNHGLAQIEATLDASRSDSPAARVFLRSNVNTYIISLYDGNFDISLVGKVLERAYTRLGGPKEFRKSLTPTQVAELARAYSARGVQLKPHPWEGLVTQ